MEEKKFVVQVYVARELAEKARRLQKKSLAGSLNHHLFCEQFQCTMPGQHSPDKEPLSLQIPRTLMGRLIRKAAQLRMTVPAYVIAILTERTNDITLTSEDYEAIAAATREAERSGRRCATRFDGSPRAKGKARGRREK